MFLTGGKESRTLPLTWLGPRVKPLQKPAKNEMSNTPFVRPAIFLGVALKDNRAYIVTDISALIEKIIAWKREKCNDFATRIALMSVALVLPNYFTERTTVE